MGKFRDLWRRWLGFPPEPYTVTAEKIREKARETAESSTESRESDAQAHEDVQTELNTLNRLVQTEGGGDGPTDG